MNAKNIAVIAALVIVGTLIGVAIAGYKDARTAPAAPVA